MAKLKRHVADIFKDDGSGYIIPKTGSKEIQTYEHPEKKLQTPEKKYSQEDKLLQLTPKPADKQLPAKNILITSKPLAINLSQTPRQESFTLIISEKPQAAMKIAFALADTSPAKKNFYGIPYWEIEKDRKKYVIASAVGHLYGLKQKGSSSSKDWPSFDLEWKETESFGRKYINALKSLAKDADDVILATDYDVEGELIGFNVLRFIFNREQAQRMKFSALTKYDLQNSFNEIEKTLNYGQAYAGETRHYLDWFYGINLSRALMETIKAVGSFRILSIGRVQGPSLAMIVELERKIQEFKSTPYWQVFLLIEDTKGQQIEVKFPENITSEEEANKFLKLKGKKGKAETTKEVKDLRPWPPFDLTSLQMESYKFFRFSPAQTLALAQKLYLAGLISYPRTSSQKLPPSIGYNRILDKLKKAFPNLSKNLTRDFPVQGGKNDPAHPAIFPTGEQSFKISAEEKKVYELIVKRFLACFSPDALIENKKIKVNVIEKEFFTEGKKILKQGWLEIYPYKITETNLPEINGEIIVKESRLEQKMTEPPRRYSPASIILELEKRKLGTKSTRASIIDTLYKRGYIAGSQIQATQLGLATVDTLKKNSPTILDEALTREFEEKMEKILEEKSPEKMKQEESEILDNAKQIIIKISQEFKNNEQEIGKSLMEATREAEEKKQEANKLFTCPECKKGDLIMKRGHTGKRYVACNNDDCHKTYPLPQFGLVKVSDRKCPTCPLPQLVLIKKSRLPWYFCMNPACWKPIAEAAKAEKEAKAKVRTEKKAEKEKLQSEKRAEKQKIRKKKERDKERAKKLREKKIIEKAIKKRINQKI